MILTLSNLYPRPDEPERGLFNAQLFRALAARVPLTNICLVPEWRVWNWRAIRRWKDRIGGAYETRYVPVFYVPVLGRSVSAWTYGWTLRPSVVPRVPVEAIYTAWLYPDGVAGVRLARQAGVASWLMALGSDTFHLRSSARRRAILQACAQAGGVVCVWRGLAERLAAAGVEAGKLHVIPNGVDATRFRFRDREEARRKLLASGAPAAAFSGTLVLFVGHLVRIKGPDLLVEAFERLQEGGEGARMRLVVIGEGVLKKALAHRVAERKLQNRVWFLGAVRHEEVAWWMSAADVLCLSSRSEGMPNVVLEAGASGLPVVATDVGGVREILQNEPLGRIVAPENAAALAVQLAGWQTTATERQAMASRFAGRYSWERQAEMILERMRGEGQEAAGNGQGGKRG